MRQTWERKYAKPFLTLKIIILIHLNFFEWLFLVWVFLVRLIFSLWKVLKIFKTSHYIMCVFTKSYPALCDPLDCSPPGFSVHGISQARILEQVAISSSRGPFWPRDRTCSSCIGRWILYQWATWEAYHYYCSKMIDKILSWIEFQNVLFRKSKFLGSKITAY